MDHLVNHVLFPILILFLGIVIGYFIGYHKKKLNKPLGDSYVDTNAAFYGFVPAKDVLAKLIRAILWDRNIIPHKWDKLIDAYINDPRNEIGNSHRERSVARGNLNKEISSPTVSWRVFEKFLRIINPSSVQLRVEVVWKDGTRSVNAVNLNTLKYEATDG
jgi:hypothetical protein